MSASYPRDWHETTIGDVFDRMSKSIDVDPKSTYQEIGIRSHGKGIFAKKPVSGVSLGEKRVFAVEPECLILNIVFAWEQAVAKTTSSEVGKVVSHRFPMYRPKPGRVDVNYALYFFKSKWGKNLLEIASPGGAGRNKTLNQSNFADLPIVLPPLAEQRRIVAVLDAWDRAIDQTERLIAAKRQRKTAIVSRALTVDGAKRGFIRDFADVNPRNRRVSNETMVSFVAMQDVSANGELISTADRLRGELGNGYTQFADGDVLVAKITPCFENGKGALAAGLTNATGFGTTEFHVVRPHDPADADYLHQITMTRGFRISGERHMTGSAGQRRVPAEFIEDFPVFMMGKKARQEAGRLLACLDKELSALEKAQLSLGAQKRGLMHRLMAGVWQLDDRFDPVSEPQAALPGAPA
jgi:type I restriction enzyme S subunit